MMIHVNLDSQVRRIAGCRRTSIEVDENASLEEVIQKIAFAGNDQLRNTLLDDRQAVRQSILVFMDDELVTREQHLVLRAEAELTLTTLISGG